MKIHSNTLTAQDIRAAVPDGCYLAGHYIDDEWATVHLLGSRTRDHAFSVRLSGSSKSTMRSLPDKSATWDEWGIFIAAIYERDPDAICGGWYSSRQDFIDKTRAEYERVSRYRPDLNLKAPWLNEKENCPFCGDKHTKDRGCADE